MRTLQARDRSYGTQISVNLGPPFAQFVADFQLADADQKEQEGESTESAEEDGGEEQDKR